MIDKNQDISGKKLLVLGGTRISCEIIKKAKDMGLIVGVADYNSIENSPGKQICDYSHLVDVTNVDLVVDLINNEKYDGVITGFSDMLLPYYAEICEKSGKYCYATKEQFEIFTEKNKYKHLLRKFSIPTVEEYRVDSNNVESTINNIRYPVLVKPSDSSGSRGITICRNHNELKSAFSKALKYSKNCEILVERYMEGREATVFWIFQDGKYHLMALGNRHVKNNQKGVIPLPVGYTYPSVYLTKYEEIIADKCKEMFKYIGIKNGMMFMQCKIENDLCVVYDIGYRLTGSLEYNNIEDTCGFNPLEMMIYYSITGKMHEKDISEIVDPRFGGKYGFNVSTLSAPGLIETISGINETKEIDGVIDCVPAHLSGEEITDKMKGLLSQITVRTLGTVDSQVELYPKMKKIEETIKIISNGRNNTLPGIEYDDIEGYVL